MFNPSSVSDCNLNDNSLGYIENCQQTQTSRNMYIHPSHPIKGSRLSGDYLSPLSDHFHHMQYHPSPSPPTHVSWTDNDDIPFTIDDDISTFPIELPASPPSSSARSSKWSLSSTSSVTKSGSKSKQPPVSRRYSGIAHFYQPANDPSISFIDDNLNFTGSHGEISQDLVIPELEGALIGDKTLLSDGTFPQEHEQNNYHSKNEQGQDPPRRRSLYVHGGRRLYTFNASTAASAPSETSLLFSSISPRDISLVLPAPDLIMDTTPELEYAFPRPNDMNL